MKEKLFVATVTLILLASSAAELHGRCRSRPQSQTKTLVERLGYPRDTRGYLYPFENEAAAHMNIQEAEAEIRAQIARARALGIQPTHLDSHMGTLYQNKALFEMLARVARENKLPFRVSQEWFARAPFMPSLLGPEDVVLDSTISIEPSVAPEDWSKFYTNEIKSLRAGVSG